MAFTYRTVAWALHLVLWLLLSPGLLGGQLLTGRVTDAETGKLVRDASITVFSSEGEVREFTTTTRGGRFFMEVRDLSVSDYAVVEGLGYHEQRIVLGDIAAFGAMGVALDVALAPNPLPTEGLTARVSGRKLMPRLVQAGFYQRQHTHFGEYLVIDDLARAQARAASDLLQYVQGVKLDRRGNLQGREPRLRRAVAGVSGAFCYPTVFLDGALARRGGAANENHVMYTPFDQIVSSNHIQAIEVYASASQLPTQFNALQGNCGVILVWTR